MVKSQKAFSSFSVDDFQKAKDFYSNKLGLEISEFPEMKGLLYLQMNDSNKILVYAKSNHSPATFTILNFPVNDIEKAVNELSAQGIKFEIYNESNLKTDEKGIARFGNIKQAWF